MPSAPKDSLHAPDCALVVWSGDCTCEFERPNEAHWPLPTRVLQWQQLRKKKETP